MESVESGAQSTTQAAKRGARGREGRRRSRERARAGLVDSALGLAADAPFHDLTVDEIARAAGISRSAFYTHFRDKHELLLVAVEGLAEELRPAAGGWWESEGPPAERVGAALRGLAGAWAERAGLLRVVTEVATYDEEVRASWLSLIEAFAEATASQIRSEQAVGLIADTLDPEPAAEGLVLMAERSLYLHLSLGDRTAEQAVEAILPVWVAALYPGVVPAELFSPAKIDGARDS